MAWNNTTVPDETIFISGSSSMDNGLRNYITNSLCEPNTTDVYLSGGINGKNRGMTHSAIFCTVKASKVPNLQWDAKVLFLKRSIGGSGLGVAPLIESRQIEALNIFKSSCTQTNDNPNNWICNTNEPDPFTLLIPDFGISDVEPLLFRGPNTPAGYNPVTGASAQLLETRVVAALLFGVPVTNGLYNALQVIQKDRGELPDTCQIGDYTETCMPSLSRQQIATLISGTIQNWDEFKFEKDGQTYSFTDYPGVDLLINEQKVATGREFSNFVHFCKRTSGSGTGAQQYIKYLNNPCASGTLSPSEWDNPFDGPRALLNSSSGSMDQCLDDFDKGTNYSRSINGERHNQDIFSEQPIVGWAFGQQSMEKNANLQSGYKFIKIDGVAPTLVNAHKGTYNDWVETSFQWRKNSLTGNKLRIIEKIVADSMNPAYMNIYNQYSDYSFGQSGYLASPINGYTYSSALGQNSPPVIPYSHGAIGVLNNCRVPVIPPAPTDKPL